MVKEYKLRRTGRRYLLGRAQGFGKREGTKKFGLILSHYKIMHQAAGGEEHSLQGPPRENEQWGETTVIGNGHYVTAQNTHPAQAAPSITSRVCTHRLVSRTVVIFFALFLLGSHTQK